MLPLRIELAMTFTKAFPNVQMGDGGQPAPAACCDAVSGRNILIWLANASVLLTFSAVRLMATIVSGTPWWDRNRYADRRPFLEKRAAITERVRHFFRSQGFVEVETPILQVSPGNETHLHAPRTELIDRGGNRLTRYLRTSPEFAAKKLLAAGEEKIFELARVFRDRERGDLHLPEFTMLEWYRAGKPLRCRHGRCLCGG